MKKLVVLDFDGTFTDVEKEGAGFTAAYRSALGELAARDPDAAWARAEEQTKDPEAGWVKDGVVVAPANCDPYIRATCIATAVCEEWGYIPTRPLRESILQALYSHCYATATTSAPRPEAAEVLQALANDDSLVVRVVTNSDTATVTKKLEELRIGVTIQVIGSARKYSVTQKSIEGVAEFMMVEGAQRKLLLWRSSYHAILRDLWRQTGTDASSTLVCGDIFELDLALPLSLGTRGHLLLRDNTHAFERAALARFGARGTSSSTLRGLLDVVAAWR